MQGEAKQEGLSIDRRLGPVIRLQPYHEALVAMDPAHRAEQAAHLQALAADPDALARLPPPDWPDDTGPAPSTDGPVCGTCRGRCCVQGVAWQGFIDARLLHRRQAAHGGTLADAAAFYTAMLPAEHVRFSCLYHGAEGCVLPRADRAPICNGYACDPLKQARALQQADPQAPLVLAGVFEGRVEQAVVLRGQTLGEL